MVEPLHAKTDKAAAAVIEKPRNAPEQAAAKKRNTVALMRSQGWDFAEQPNRVSSPEQKSFSLPEALTRTRNAREELAAWRETTVQLNRALTLAHADEKSALSAVGLLVGARADRIARTQTEIKVLEADIAFRAKQKSRSWKS